MKRDAITSGDAWKMDRARRPHCTFNVTVLERTSVPELAETLRAYVPAGVLVAWPDPVSATD